MSWSIRKLFTLSPLLLSVILTGFVCLVYIIGPSFLEIVELKALDLRFLIRGPLQPGPEVVIAAIDEKSVDEIGRWPWPRSRIAEMIEAMSSAGAKVIAFDVGFFEPDANTNLALIDKLGGEIKRLGVDNPNLDDMLGRERLRADNDLILAQALKNSTTPVVLGYFFHVEQDEGLHHLTQKEVKARGRRLTNAHYTFTRLASPEVELKNLGLIRAFLPETNIGVLSESTRATGYFNMFPDFDGTVRQVPLSIYYEDKACMPLSLQALRYYLVDAPSSLTLSRIGVEAVTLGDYKIPTDEIGRMQVNFRGPGKTFPHYSIADILKGRLAPATFKDKIVLVGATAVGIYDLRVTPFDRVFPGVEIHANAIDNILRGDFLVAPNWAAIFDLMSITFIGLLLGLGLPRLSAWSGALLGTGLLAIWVLGNYLLFLQGFLLNSLYPFMTLVLVYTGITLFRYMTEEREKKKIRSAFSYYVNPSVVSEMLKNPDKLKLGGEKRIMTVLFSDIRGFTSISEKLDPEALVHLLNRYLTDMTDLVFKNEGLLDKYIGDAIMAVWGAPLDQPRHAALACRTGLEMMSALARLREQLAAEDPNTPFLDIGIGLNSGPMVAGNMGSETRFDYTVMGDSVNLGSRLEGACKQYGVNIIIGEMTFEQVKSAMYCRELDSVAVKGKAQPVRIFELLGEPGRVPEDRLRLARAFQSGLTAYRHQMWVQAHKVFSALHHHYPDDRPTKLYIERVAELTANPPGPSWDGVYVMKTK